jgi:hypothetical protein
MAYDNTSEGCETPTPGLEHVKGYSDEPALCQDCSSYPSGGMSREEIGDQSDNAAEAQALAQTNPGALATPRDRSSDPNRQAHALEQSIMEHSLGGMPQYTDHQCSNHGGTGEHDENENNVCPDCGSDWAESQREPY